METIDQDSFEQVISQVSNGEMFETFTQDFLCARMGVEFLPVGGKKDRGIDGLEHTFHDRTEKTTVYQLSINAHPRGKIEGTIKTLISNGISLHRLYYVTNQVVPHPEDIIDDMYNKYKVTLLPRDIKWLRGNINHSLGTIASYRTFLNNNYHEYKRPGVSYHPNRRISAVE